MQQAVRNVISNIATYKNMFASTTVEGNAISEKIGSYINKNSSNIKNELENKGIKVVMIGNGNKIIAQYPRVGEQILKGETVILKTDDTNIQMPNMIGWSRNLVEAYANLTSITLHLNGYGFVTEQSIKEGELLQPGATLSINLAQKYALS